MLLKANLFIFLFIFLANTLLLKYSQCPFALQFIGYLGIFYIFLFGYGFLKIFLKLIWNEYGLLSRAFFAFFVGAGACIIFCYALLNKAFLNLYSWTTIQACWLISCLLFPIALYGLIEFIKNFKKNYITFINLPTASLMLFIWGGIISFISTYGFTGHLNPQLWGSHHDRNYHLGLFCVDFQENGIGNLVLHYGIQSLCCWLTSLNENLTFGNVYKPISLIAFCAIAYFSYLMSREILRLNRFWSFMIGIFSLSWGTINVPMFTLSRDHYMGGFIGAASSGFYANESLTLSHAFCAAGAYITARGIKQNKINFFVLSALLFTISFFIKPSSYTIFALPLFLLIFLKYQHGFLKITLLSLFIITFPIFYQLFYPMLYQWITGDFIAIEKIQLTFGLFKSSLDYSNERFYEFIENSRVLKSMAIAACSYLIFLIAQFLNLLNWKQLNKEDKYLFLFAHIVLLLGILSGTLFASHNFTWATMSSLVFFLPFLFKIYLESSKLWLKFAFIVTASFHIWGGLLHLYLNYHGR